MTIRAKIQLTHITQSSWGNKDDRILKFAAIYDETIPEEQRFQKATPSAEFTMTVNNPVALEQFVLGEKYYVDFTLASIK